MRICLYTETALPAVGGQELAVDALAREFVDAGHDVVVLTLNPRHARPTADPLLPYAVVRHPRYLSSRYLLDYYCGYLSRIHHEKPIDVLHCHNIYPAGFVAARWTRTRGIPLVLTSHACDIAPESNLLSKPHVPERMAFALGQATALIAISRAVERRYRQLCPAAMRIARIPNGVHIDEYARPVPRTDRIPVGLRPHGYFLFLGRLVHRKGADLLLDAFQQIAATVPADLVIAGTGAEEDALRAKAAQFGLAQRVHFLGVVHGADKVWLLQNCLGAVVPSRVSEGSPLVVLESFAAGVPVVGTWIPGLADTIRQNETGIVVPPDQPEDLAAAMVSLANDREFAMQLGRNGREEAPDFDWRQIALQHLDLFGSLRRGVVRRLAS